MLSCYAVFVAFQRGVGFHCCWHLSVSNNSTASFTTFSPSLWICLTYINPSTVIMLKCVEMYTPQWNVQDSLFALFIMVSPACTSKLYWFWSGMY